METHQGPVLQGGQGTGSKNAISRRNFLKLAGAAGIGLLMGSVGTGGVMASVGRFSRADGHDKDLVPFYGPHQSGILTPAQNFLFLASFDLTTEKVEEVRNLFRSWTEAAANMSQGLPVRAESDNVDLPPADTGEAAGLTPSRLTITFGVGPSFFDQRFGLAAKRPEPLVDLPHFAGESLRTEWCGGDVGVQVCADDYQVAFHAIRNLTRLARGVAVLRWLQEGFLPTSSANPAGETPRNLMGFKDGTANPDVTDRRLMNELIWVQPGDSPSWMQNGCYMVVRRIRMRIEVWDRATLRDQEATFGRHRDSGAPLGGKSEFDPLDLEAKDEDGNPVIPWNAHVRLAHSDGQERILRRSYSYSSGIEPQTGQLDAGLIFICFQRDPRKQFIPIQHRLAQKDALNEYIQHIGSAIFACLPGVRKGGYLGETLF